MPSLCVARARSKLALVDKRIEQVAWRVCLQQIAESQRRLVHLEAQVHTPPTQVDASVEALQEKIDALQKERDVLLAAAKLDPV